MAQVINTNVLSINAQRNLSTSQSSLATALQRLSSGLRINSAKDDAAGLAISDRFTTQIRGMNQAIRNASDGISLAQTAESALAELSNNLQRIRELAVQSANSTNSAADRRALNEEVTQRLAEIDRIATQTSFNGLKVLDGSFGTSQFQIGANAGETISINLSQGVRAGQIGRIATSAGIAVTEDGIEAGDVTIRLGDGDEVTVGGSAAFAVVVGDDEADVRGEGSAYAKAAAINAAGIAGLTATATNRLFFDVATVATEDDGAYALTINGTTVLDVGENTTVTAQGIVDAINSQAGETGVTAQLSNGRVFLTAADGRDIIIDDGDEDMGLNDTEAEDPIDVDGVTYQIGALGDDPNFGTITLTANERITLGGDALEAIGFEDVETIAVAGSMSAVNVLTVAASNDALRRIDAALTSVSGLRSTFGAIQNRFESTIANLQAVTENLEASRSRILDADFAAETAALTKAQILQQAGIAILAQANAQPQSVLALLQ